MLRFIAVLLLLATSNALAQQPKETSRHQDFCEKAKELATITSQLPDYMLSTQADVPAKLLPSLAFRPTAVLKAAGGQPVCIAVVVSESGTVLDASVYFPKRVSLSKGERLAILAGKYTPATQSGTPIKSIVLMKTEYK